MATPQNDKAVEFLELVYPEGPWALTAISIDKKSIETQTFYPDQKRGLLNWLKKYNGERNLYWHVNPVSQAITKKAEREDIKEVAYLHVDIDPRAGEDLDTERKRALGLLQSPTKTVKPTFIVFSGGGYQAFWKLKEPIPIDGDLGRAEDAKRYNIQLELIFGGDNCHNIDRLMRLPGTINIPDARKKKKGRQEELAEVVEHNPHRVYNIAEFTPAAPTQRPDDKGFSGGQNQPKVSGNVRRLDDIEELNEWNVTDRVKVLIVQGKVPDEKKLGDDSRSAWLFDCLCQLVRAEVPDEVIYAVITDPDFKISESVLDKGRNTEKYALRQIERAKEEAVDPWLRKLNERFAVIGNMGGRCRIVEEVFDAALKRHRLTKQSFDDFRNRHMHILVDGGKNKEGVTIRIPLGKWWLQHAKRRQYESIVFSPGRETEADVYNLWKGFAVEPKEGDCGLFLTHLKTNICNGNKDHFDYLIRWMVRAVQQPDSPGEVAVVLRGDQGVGKGLFAKQLGSLFGRHFLQVADPKHLVGSFNAHLRDCVVLFADEAFYAGDKKHESVLKMLITEETIPVEGKGLDVEVSPNFTHVIMASNSQWIIPAGKDERRFFVLDVGDSKKQDTKYFEKIRDELDNGGREALLHFLLTFELGNFQVRDVPKTKALQEQKIMSLSPDEEWWYRKLHDGRVLVRDDGWHNQVSKRELFVDYVRYMQEAQIMARRSNETVLGQFIRRVVPAMLTRQLLTTVSEIDADGVTKKKKRRAYHYCLPDLDQCRASWAKIYGEEVWGDPNACEDQPELPKAKEPF